MKENRSFLEEKKIRFVPAFDLIKPLKTDKIIKIAPYVRTYLVTI